VAGMLTVFFDVADQSYLPVLIDTDDLVEATQAPDLGFGAQILDPRSWRGDRLVAAPFAISSTPSASSPRAASSVIANRTKPERKVGVDGSHTSLRQEIAEGLRYVMETATCG